MCTRAFPACIYVCYVCAWLPGVRKHWYFGAGVKDGYELPCEYWDLTLQEQMLLTVESSHYHWLFFKSTNVYVCAPVCARIKGVCTTLPPGPIPFFLKVLFLQPTLTLLFEFSF